MVVAAAERGVPEFRARDKEDRRGGGEGLVVLGPHVFNLMYLLEDPQ
jgi:hypothetical protein